jgi:hypothetical protein
MTTATIVGESTTVTVVAMTIKIIEKTRIGTEIIVTTSWANGLVKTTRKLIRSKDPLVVLTTRRTLEP